ncbi:MAG: stage 0 sporulation family protein [Clostridia bacterium]|nr:stage 0 sporulation family protein [Clostridia bacterium]
MSSEQHNGKKPYHKHHRRRPNSNKQGDNRSEQNSGDSITVRPGRYDLPPSQAQNGEFSADLPKAERSEAAGSAVNGDSSRPPRHHRHKNDRRGNNKLNANTENARSTAEVISETTETNEHPTAETSGNSNAGESHRRRRPRGGRRHSDYKKEREASISETGTAASADSEYTPERIEDDSLQVSEYITTAGSLDAEVVDELNSVTESEAELIENAEPEPEVELAKYEIVGVRFKAGGKIYYFDPNGLKIAKNDPVIVETARGLEYGICDISNKIVTEREVVLPLRTVSRPATTEDTARHTANVAKEQEAFVICSQKILDHKLGMKLIDVEYAFDGSKLLFYFTAEGRVDFRELVKDLAAVFRTRIELRQIGIRDETKLLGGIGICGRPFCCKTFLSDFVQVSIKMAKEQNLSLNSVKISGACGRLMCCLRYEYDTYQEEIKKTPKVDQIVSTPDGEGTVIEVQPLAGLVRVRFGSKADMIPPKVYHRDDVTVIGGKGVKPKETADR